MASQVLGIAGAVVGSFFGVPQLGYMVGSALGAALFPPPGVDGPRLGDLTVQKSAYGAAIPIVYGKYRLSGNIIWSTQLVEHASEGDSGSGGGGPTTYTYTCSFAVGLCEGIHGVTRIWGDSKLIYDIYDTAAPVKFQSGGFVVYPGDEAQLPDPTIEVDKGVGNAPAYRGLTYVVFTDLELGKFGNRIPNLTFEIGAEPSHGGLSLLFHPSEQAYPEPGVNAGYEFGLDYNVLTDTFWQLEFYFPNTSEIVQATIGIIDATTMSLIDTGLYSGGAPGLRRGLGEPYMAAFPVVSTTMLTPPESRVPPETPNLMASYLLPTGGTLTHAWVGHAGEVATWTANGWYFRGGMLGTMFVDLSTNLVLLVGELELADPFEDRYYFQPKGLRVCGVHKVVFTYDHRSVRGFDAITGMFLFHHKYGSDSLYLFSDTHNLYLEPMSGEMWITDDSGAIRRLSPTNGYTLETLVETRPAKHKYSIVFTNDGDVYYGQAGSNTMLFPEVINIGRTAAYAGTHPPQSANSIAADAALPFEPVLPRRLGIVKQSIYWLTYDATRNRVMYVIVFFFDNEPPERWIEIINVATNGVIFRKQMGYVGGDYSSAIYYDESRDILFIQSYSSPVGFDGTGTVAGYHPYYVNALPQYAAPEGMNRTFRGRVITTRLGNCVYEASFNSNGIARFCWGVESVKSTPTLGGIVSDITRRTPLSSSQIDVTQLEEPVIGYCITNNMSARAAIEPLMQAYFFDNVESGEKVKFVKRGSASVVTVDSTQSLLEK